MALVLAAVLVWQLSGWPGGGADREVWAVRADEAGAELDLLFWDDKRGMFNNASPCILQACTDPFNYWWQAHAADALLDRYERTKDGDVRKRVGELFDGIRDRNAGVWTNGYYDDMEWMALAWLRAYELLGDDKYKEAALELWADIRGGWNEEMGGGIAWRKDQLDYKNTPANAPAVILAARLYRNFGSRDDLEWALKIYDWQKRTLVDPESTSYGTESTGRETGRSTRTGSLLTDRACLSARRWSYTRRPTRRNIGKTQIRRPTTCLTRWPVRRPGCFRTKETATAVCSRACLSVI